MGKTALNGYVANNSPRRKYIAIAQFISAVILIISGSFPKELDLSNIFGLINFKLQIVAVAFLIFMSGYLIVKNNLLEENSYSRILFKGALNLLLPYIAVNAAAFFLKAYFTAGPDINTGLAAQLQEFAYTLIFPNASVCPILWFLPALFVMLMVAPVFDSVLKNNNIYITLIFFLGMFVILFLPDTLDALAINQIKTYSIWFFLGMVAARYKYEFSKVIESKNAPLFIAAAIIIDSIESLKVFSWFIYVLSMILAILSISRLISKSNYSGKMEYLFSIKTLPFYLFAIPAQTAINYICQIYSVHFFITSLLMLLGGVFIPFCILKVTSFIDEGILKFKLFSYFTGVADSLNLFSYK